VVRRRARRRRAAGQGGLIVRSFVRSFGAGAPRSGTGIPSDGGTGRERSGRIRPEHAQTPSTGTLVPSHFRPSRPTELRWRASRGRSSSPRTRFRPRRYRLHARAKRTARPQGTLRPNARASSLGWFSGRARRSRSRRLERAKRAMSPAGRRECRARPRRNEPSRAHATSRSDFVKGDLGLALERPAQPPRVLEQDQRVTLGIVQQHAPAIA
jgi:hypothetical protein